MMRSGSNLLSNKEMARLLAQDMALVEYIRKEHAADVAMASTGIDNSVILDVSKAFKAGIAWQRSQGVCD